MKLGEGHKALTGAPQDRVGSVNDTPKRKMNITGLSSAIDKLTFAIEDDVRKLVEEIGTVDAKRQNVMAKAREQIAARAEAVDQLSTELDKLDTQLGDNSGERGG